MFKLTWNVAAVEPASELCRLRCLAAQSLRVVRVGFLKLMPKYWK